MWTALKDPRPIFSLDVDDTFRAKDILSLGGEQLVSRRSSFLHPWAIDVARRVFAELRLMSIIGGVLALLRRNPKHLAALDLVQHLERNEILCAGGDLEYVV